MELRALAEEQAALLRVAELVASAAPAQEVFAAVATEAALLLNGEAMTLTRFDGEREMLVEATHHGPAPIGTRIAFEADTLPDWAQHGAIARVDDYAHEKDADLAKQYGLRAAVSAPISVAGEAWGMLTATSGERPLPAGTSIGWRSSRSWSPPPWRTATPAFSCRSSPTSRERFAGVAELAARGATSEEVLEAVAVQASALAGVDFTTLLRYEPDGSTG